MNSRAYLPACAACVAALCATGCSDSNGAPKTAARGDAEGCLQEFVQRYEYDDGGMGAHTITPSCPEDNLSGPPAFPRSTTVVTVEFSNGDFYAVQERRTWGLGELDMGRKCMHIVLDTSRVVLRKQGDVKESTHQKGNELKRSAATGENYGSMIALGGAITAGAGAGISSRTEPTAFGVDCQRYLPQSGTGPQICAVPLPHDCPARHVMLPIELRIPAGEGIEGVGRTTQLRTGDRGALVDRAGWELP